MKKVVVIFSGGQDSTTCLHWALNRYDQVEAITFNYGQKHSIELDQAKLICDKNKVKQTVIDISFLDTLVDSALTSNGDVNEINDKGLPASFVPNRNQLFITLSHAYAQKIGAEALVTGVCQTDYSGYPDCRETFVKAVEWTTNMGSDSNIKIETPLMYLTKSETFELAQTENCLDEVVGMSHTCYNGDRTKLHDWGYGCDDCPACELRKNGYNEFIQLKGSIIKNF
jgi:7-cyano-7-deazaguanine synthase